MNSVLDVGFVRLIDTMGDDSAIVQAARVSYGEGTKTPSDDEALIRYLMRRKHSTPFEMCEIKLHLKMPIFVARQWVRHRTASVNEISGRYSVMKEEFYSPCWSDICTQDTVNKQGRAEPLEGVNAEFCADAIAETSEDCFDAYQELLEYGVARETARIVLPLNTYTEFYWKIDLHNLFHFLKLRMDSHAQSEIRAFANQIYDLVKLWVPMAAKAFEDYALDAVTLSGPAKRMIKDLLENGSSQVTDSGRESYGIGKREFADLQKELGL